MPDLDDLLHRAVEQRHMPFAVAMVADRDYVRWSGAVGKSSPQAEADLNTVFRIFSMGKAIGSLAALILVDRGLLTLETPVGSVLKEFGDIRVLDSFGPAGPVLRPPRRPVTVRHLLTNTAGFAYEGWNSRQALYALMTGALHPNSGARIAIEGPLMFDPGDGMTYGYGFDWIGSLVARLDGRDAVTFCQDEIFDPIGMPDTMFEPDRAGARLAQTSMRSPDDSFTPFDVSPPAKPEIYGLGQCLYGTAPDYMQFLRFILNDGEIDGRHLLSREVMAMMKTPQSGGLTMPLMKTMAPLLSADVELVTSSVTTWTQASPEPDRRAGQAKRGIADLGRVPEHPLLGRPPGGHRGGADDPAPSLRGRAIHDDVRRVRAGRVHVVRAPAQPDEPPAGIGESVETANWQVKGNRNVMWTGKFDRMFIGGEWVAPTTHETLFGGLPLHRRGDRTGPVRGQGGCRCGRRRCPSGFRPG